MTTIVCKDGVMCSDSQATRGDFIDSQEVSKIFEVHGCLIGISGSLIGAMKFIDWFAENLEHTQAQEDYPHITMTPPEELVNKDFHCLVMYPDKTIYEFCGSDDVLKVETPYTAVGSGMFYALSALDAGVSPQEAVEIAIKRDVFSGGAVQTFQVDEPKQLTEEDVRELDKEQLVNLVLTGNTEPVDENEKDESETGEREIIFSCIDSSTNVEIIITEDGDVFDSGGLIGSFSSILEEADHIFYSVCAKMLEVKHAHNISNEKLALKLDLKVEELVANHNK